MQAYFILSPWVLLWVFSVFHLLFVLWVKSPTWCFCFSSADRWLPNSETFCDFPVNIVIINTMTCFYKHLLCFISLSKIQLKYSWRSSTMFCWYCYNGFSFLFHWIDRFLPNIILRSSNIVSDTFVSVIFESVLANKWEPLLFWILITLHITHRYLSHCENACW